MADRARVKDLYGFGAVSPGIEDSVQRARSARPEPLSDRELLTESILAALFVVVAIALIEIGNPGHVQVDAAIVLTIAFALLSRFEFETGAGYTVATQLAFVPMLFVLPPELAPALVAAGRLLSGLPEFMRGELPWDRVITRLDTLQIAAENVTSLSFRSMRPQVMNGATSSSAGAVAVPLVTSGGCTGVLAAETRESKPAAETVAVARILAAQFATLIAPSDAAASRAAAQA